MSGKYYIRSTSEEGNWNDSKNPDKVIDIRDLHEIDTNKPYYAIVDEYGNRVYGIDESQLKTNPENNNQYAIWSRAYLPDNFRYNTETERYEATPEQSNLTTPSLTIFDKEFYRNPNVVKYNTKMDEWKRLHPWLNFAYDALASSPVLFPALLSGVGGTAQLLVNSPILAGASLVTGVAGGYLGGQIFNKGIMLPLTGKTVGEWVYNEFGYPEVIGEMANPGAAVGGTIGGVLPFGIRNFNSNGGINTAKLIIKYQPSTPAEPVYPEGWKWRKGKAYPKLETNYIQSKTPIKSRINLSRTSNESIDYYPIENLYTKITDLDGFPVKIELSLFDSNVIFIPRENFAEIHFGTAREGGKYVNYQGTVGKAGHPSLVGKFAGIRAISKQPSNTYFGPDSKISSWMRRLDLGSNKIKELSKIITLKYNPNHEINLTADGWNLNSKQNEYSVKSISDNSYISLNRMKELSLYIELDEFGKDLMALAKHAELTKNLKELNKFLSSKGLPKAYFLDEEIRLPVVLNKRK